MKAEHLHQTLATEGTLELLRELDASNATTFHVEQIRARMQRLGVPDPEELLTDLLASNVFHQMGDSLGITTFGLRTLLLLEALNGQDVRDVYRRLSHLDSRLRMYELVREGMTSKFLRSLNDRPGFLRLYLCSPWIRFSVNEQRLLANAVVQEEGRGVCPELIVITRREIAAEALDALTFLKQLGASVYFNPRLHTKLYIREPGQSGGFPMAIVGSQNLTRSNYLELGIRINADGIMVDQLIAYFWELCSASVADN